MVDPIVTLMMRLVSEPQEVREVEPHEVPEPPEGEVNYWLTLVASDEKGTAEETIQTLVGQEKAYAFGERTPGRAQIKPGDWICFYAAATGVVAQAKVASRPEKRPHLKVRDPDRFPWTFRLSDVSLYLKDPVLLDSPRWRSLDAYKEKEPDDNWSWFVQSTRKINEHDFRLLTRRAS